VSEFARQLESLKASTIMMVDDEPTTLEVLEEFLRGEGYRNFVTTTDSRNALDLVRGEKPDVLLLDLMMPHVAGLEILGAMRAADELERVPVIILTSSLDAGTKLEALELGATDFLGKPVDPSELALRLRNTLAAKAYRDRLAHYDDLTGLPNRRSFLERLERSVRRAREEARSCCVFQVGLDRFKQINDTLGPAVGDALLRAVAVRLERIVRPGDLVGVPAGTEGTLSRIAGDEFSLCLTGLEPIERAARIAQRIVAAVAEPYSVEGKELFVTSSIGIARFPDDGEVLETLLRNASTAMSHAKQEGANTFRFYSPSLNAESAERLALESRLRRAVERGELRLHYQPKVDIRTGRVVGAEALLRWQHPELGLVPPDRFIPIAEESGLMAPLGEWALHAACRQAKAWEAAGLPLVRMSVNVSSVQFRSNALLGLVRGALEASGLEPQRLVLELTESVLMENPESAAQTLNQIVRMGPGVSIDDFGTGYSSLGYLKRFPIDELKIDRSFVKGVPHDGDDAAIVSAIIGMAHALGLSVVAEGVETEEQLEFLEERGCEGFQGFLFSRPVPAEEWEASLARACDAAAPFVGRSSSVIRARSSHREGE
jgi:diguanylate cyclase (GGDEF)-like protein